MSVPVLSWLLSVHRTPESSQGHPPTDPDRVRLGCPKQSQLGSVASNQGPMYPTLRANFKPCPIQSPLSHGPLSSCKIRSHATVQLALFFHNFEKPPIQTHGLGSYYGTLLVQALSDAPLDTRVQCGAQQEEFIVFDTRRSARTLLSTCLNQFVPHVTHTDTLQPRYYHNTQHNTYGLCCSHRSR